MKKRTKSKRPRQPRTPRASRKQRTSTVAGIIDLRRKIWEGLVSEIGSAVAKTAHQLVEESKTKSSTWWASPGVARESRL